MDFLQNFSTVPVLLAQTAETIPSTTGPSNAEFWLVKWASPFFLIGLGILAGLVLLGLFLVLVKVLSRVEPWEKLSQSSAGHFVAAVLTAITGGVAIWLIHTYSFYGRESSTEKSMIYLAVFLLSAIFGWALVFCAGRKSADTLLATLTEGASLVLGGVVLIVMVVGLLAGLIFPQPQDALASIPRLFQTGTRAYTFDIPAMSTTVDQDQATLTEIPLAVDYQLLTSLVIRSTTNVDLADASASSGFSEAPRQLAANEELNWSRRDGRAPPIPLTAERHLYVRNNEVVAGQLTIEVTTTPPVPEASTILTTMMTIFLAGLAILLQQAVVPRASAVALATIKNEVAQPLFMVLTLIGGSLIILFVFLSFYTFGEDIKLLKECGIVVIMLLAAFQGIWSASSSISEEIEGRTALTVLSNRFSDARSFSASSSAHSGW